MAAPSFRVFLAPGYLALIRRMVLHVRPTVHVETLGIPVSNAPSLSVGALEPASRGYGIVVGGGGLLQTEWWARERLDTTPTIRQENAIECY